MDEIKRIIGIDVYRDHYDACFKEVNNNNTNYYTGSCKSDYGKERLMARIDDKDVIIISESMLAAIFKLKFVDNVKIVNNKLIGIINNANVERGKKIATFYVNNLVNKGRDKLSDKMIKDLLIAGDERIKECERLNDISQKFIGEIHNGESVKFSEVLDLEVDGRIYSSCNKRGTNKIDDIIRQLEEFEKLNDYFNK